MKIASQKIKANKKKYFKTSASMGITLIETLLISIILAILTAIAVRIHLNRMDAITLKETQEILPRKTENPKLNEEQRTILAIENAMKLYKIDNGFYPTTAQGISALVVKPTSQPIPEHWIPYLETIPLDQNGKLFHYENPGKHKEIDVYSDSNKPLSY